jgi:hypothetical protein
VAGEVLITGCGPAICAVADVLTTYLVTYPEHPSLKKWVKRIADAVRKMRNSDTVTEVPVSQITFMLCRSLTLTTKAA